MRLNLEKDYDSIAKLFSDSLKLKILLSDVVFVTLVKTIFNRRIFSSSLSLFQTNYIISEKIPQWSLLLRFFKLSKCEKNYRGYLLLAREKYIEGGFVVSC
jgi:hypothetical protein